MKKIIIKIILVCFSALMFVFAGFIVGYEIADYKAFRSVFNDEQTDALERLIEHDTNATVKTAYYNYENGTGYVVLKDNTTEEIYTINVEVKKYAPFRYEWMEAE